MPVEELAQIEGFDTDVSEELRARARSHLEEQDRLLDEQRKSLGVADELSTIEGLSPAALVKLGEAGVKTLDDLGDLASDELIEHLGSLAPSAEQADTIIMAARAHWFENEPAAAAVPAENA